ncbi:MAG: sulfatase-like hydrolase/transferase [Myxococcota bacterium]
MRCASSLIALLALILPACGCGSGGGGSSSNSTPNILFVIMDDVGMDQMEVFGYGGETAASTPNIADIAQAGIRFRNTWSMPACSTSRAVFFEARYPLRTNVKGALGPDDLANSMVSPYEVTVPKLLAQQGYDNAIFGKFHLGLQGHDPAGYGMPYQLGWDFFAGWLDATGDPSSIDKTAGGVAPVGVSYECGFVPAASEGGADSGACYLADASCLELGSSGLVPPGRSCRDQGGILDPNQSCQTPMPDDLDFDVLSGHFVSPLVYNRPDGSIEVVPASDPRARRFRATFAVDEAIGWINARPAGRPWMATVSFASGHTPLMQPPVDDALPDSREISSLDCADPLAQRILSDKMIESLDLEIGRLLVDTGLAEGGPDGRLLYLPSQSDTMVILLGDNGSLGNTVKLPFQPSRAKGTAYQTGVWVPLVIAGPLVQQPGRAVTNMVNIADLFALFGEIAGIDDVRSAVPRTIDAFPMLPYLRDPEQPGLRAWNYTEVGANLQVGGAINDPCVISGGCTQIPVSKSVCEDNNGVWWGGGADDPLTVGTPPGGYTLCCQVNAFRDSEMQSLYNILPLVSIAIRDDQYKIVENSYSAYVSQAEPCVETTDIEFYEINEDAPLPRLDYDGTDLPLAALSAQEQSSYDALSAQLAAIRASVPDCPGDGNLDYVVDEQDITDWRFYADSNGLSTVYDLNLDGLTDDADEAIIRDNLGLDCRPG